MLPVGGILCRDRDQMAQADWASGVLLRRLLSVIVAETLNHSSERLRVFLAGRAHEKRRSSIRTIHLAFTLASAPVVSLLPPYPVHNWTFDKATRTRIPHDPHLTVTTKGLSGRLANNQVTCQDLLAYLLTLASKQLMRLHFSQASKSSRPYLLACLLAW